MPFFNCLRKRTHHKNQPIKNLSIVSEIVPDCDMIRNSFKKEQSVYLKRFN